MVNEKQKDREPFFKPTPNQLVHQLRKKYEHLKEEDRRVLIVAELHRYDLTDKDIDHLVRDFG